MTKIPYFIRIPDGLVSFPLNKFTNPYFIYCENNLIIAKSFYSYKILKIKHHHRLINIVYILMVFLLKFTYS